MKTIRIVLDDGLLREVDQFVEDRFKSRSDFFNQACGFFISYLREQQHDQIYKKGYENIPEAPEMGKVSALLAASTMEKEDWE